MKLLLIAPTTRAMAESAVKAGYDFFTIDFFGDLDQKAICLNYSLREKNLNYTIEELYRVSEPLDFTHVVYGAGFENHPELVEKFEEKCTVLGNDAKTLRKVRNWRYFFKKASKLGISTPNTEIVSAEELHDLEGRIAKSVRSGGGHHIFTSKEEIMEGEFLVQEVVEGMPVSSSIICSPTECRYLGANEQLIGDETGRFKYCGNISPADVDLEEVSLKIADEFNLRGLNGIDFICGDEVYLLEVNPRITGAMEVMEKAYNINLLDLHIKACLGELAVGDIGSMGYYGKKIIYAPRDLFFNIEAVAFIKDIPHQGEFIPEGSPVCTVIGHGSTRDECYKDLIAKEKMIRESLRESYLKRQG